MSGEDLTVVETGTSSEPIYDTSTHKVADPRPRS
jgi:hypothetical protein